MYEKDQNSVLPWCVALPQFTDILKKGNLEFDRVAAFNKNIFHYAAEYNNIDALYTLTPPMIKKININQKNSDD